ncbi:3728_t:CDS:2 [Ambispora gerdemannii]|uniref:3728_t:CDS:1 n=1 Tax=Ambispora gerdemannii TaxID=144530 RepID=A0A9N8VXB4_9GLOM|nr:3728_t:CDS:2 [Ambispora gerdemannii]
MTAEKVPFPDPDLIRRILSNSRRAVRVSTGGGGKNNNNNNPTIPKNNTHAHSTKKNRNVPPRPPNNFFLFRHALHLHLSNLSLKVPQVSMAAGILWEKALPSTKARYSELQSEAKRWHLEMYPGYVYRPRRSVKKLTKSNNSSSSVEVAAKPSSNALIVPASAVDTRNFVISENETTQNSALSASNDNLSQLVNESMIGKTCKNYYLKKYPLSPITTTGSETSLYSPPISPLLQQQKSSPSFEFTFEKSSSSSPHDPLPLSTETRKLSYTEAYQIGLLKPQIDPILAGDDKFNNIFTSPPMNLHALHDNNNNNSHYHIYHTQQPPMHNRENNDAIQSSVDEYCINQDHNHEQQATTTDSFSLASINDISDSINISNINSNVISLSPTTTNTNNHANRTEVFSEWIKYDTQF